MQKRVRLLKVLIASPGDVVDRGVVESVINEINHERRDDPNAPVLMPVRWEKDVPLCYGDIQSHVDRWIVDDADIGIVLFWKRVGSGGALHEVDRLHGRKIPILFMVCEREPAVPRDPDLEEYLRKRRNFTYQHEYASVEVLRDTLSQQLRLLVDRIPQKSEYSGCWLEVKDVADEGGHPYGLFSVELGRGGIQVFGVSYSAEGVVGIQWANGGGDVFETSDGRLVHIYEAVDGGHVISGVSQFDFLSLKGHYYHVFQQLREAPDTSRLPRRKVSFELIRVTSGLLRLLGVRGQVVAGRGPHTTEPATPAVFVRRMHQARLHPRIIITGGSGAGKSELVEYLARTLEVSVLEESAEDIVEEWKARYGARYFSERRKRMLEFQRQILGRQIESEHSLSSRRVRRPLIMDRSGVDCIAYLVQAGRRATPEFNEYAEEQKRFTFCVFVVDTLSVKGFVDRREQGRESNRHQSVEMGAALRRVYSELGYDCRRLPEFSEDKAENHRARAEEIAKAVEQCKSFDPLAPAS